MASYEYNFYYQWLLTLLEDGDQLVLLFSSSIEVSPKICHSVLDILCVLKYSDNSDE